MDKLQVLCNLVLSVSRKLCRYRPLNNVSGAFKNTIIRYGFATSDRRSCIMIISYEIGISFPRVDLHREGKQNAPRTCMYSRPYTYIFLVRMIFKPRAHFGHSFGCPTKPFKIITRLNAHQ